MYLQTSCLFLNVDRIGTGQDTPLELIMRSATERVWLEEYVFSYQKSMLVVHCHRCLLPSRHASILHNDIIRSYFQPPDVRTVLLGQMFQDSGAAEGTTLFVLRVFSRHSTCPTSSILSNDSTLLRTPILTKFDMTSASDAPRRSSLPEILHLPSKLLLQMRRDIPQVAALQRIIWMRSMDNRQQFGHSLPR